MSSRREDIKKDSRDVVFDSLNNKRYFKGRFLGKGGFAKCYELIDSDTDEIFAGKIVPKSMLVKQHHREKMIQEINIHRSVHHKHIVGFHGYFEDADNVYIILELCRRRSLMELHKRRGTVTEPECRYFIQQIALACHYLHGLRIIHRDLKLGNLFLNDKMEIKIGDFGLATKLDYEGERKKTLCGTPNYIAPEILSKKGHSYEVDSWSLGCIVYTLLVGKPPFETSSLKDTYVRISRNEYHIPKSLSSPARALVHHLLHPDPLCRPTMEEVLNNEFIAKGYVPLGLPTSCLTMAPHFETFQHVELLRRPVEDVTEVANVPSVPSETARQGQGRVSPCEESDHVIVERDEKLNDDVNAEVHLSEKPSSRSQLYTFYLNELLTQLTTVIEAPSLDGPDVINDDAEDPAAVPIYWVSKWVDYSDKYGLGYQLCDNSVGVLFNDSTRLLLLNNGENIQYIERDGAEHFHTLKVFPETLTKKVTLLRYFRNYMHEHLLKVSEQWYPHHLCHPSICLHHYRPCLYLNLSYTASDADSLLSMAGADIAPRSGDEMTRLPFLRTWFRTRSAIVLHLSNGTLQINFFQDHTKVILCPLMGAVTYIDDSREAHTYRLQLITDFGCSKALASRLRYTHAMVQRLLSAKSSKPRATSTADH